VTEYSAAFKANMVRKLMVPGGPSAGALSAQSGISQPTLSRWLRDAKEEGVPQPKTPKSPRRPQEWKPEEKLRLLSEADGLEGEALGELLRREGVPGAGLSGWRRAALAGLGPAPKVQPGSAEARRVRELERELHRKDKALAETAALLVLQKKVQAYWGDEDDSTKKETDK